MSPASIPPESILVVIPAFNEARNIRRVAAAVMALGHQVLVVNDGSADATAAEAAAAGAEVHSLTVNTGKGAALRAGFRLAGDRRIAAVVMMDGDGQHDPAEIGRLIAVLNAEDAAMVIGSRMTDARSMPLVRRWTNRCMSWIVSRLARTRLSDTQSGFRAIRADRLSALLPTFDHFEAESEMIVHAGRRGLVIREVPVTTIYGGGEMSSIRPVRDTLRFIRFVWRMLWSCRD
ncbi:MAG: glycosyltransferase family 2 protein [Planctomycetota bacterium]